MESSFQKRVSLRDVAVAAGVSHPTVSRALNDGKGVSEALRARIKALAKDMGYRPDPALSVLATYRTNKRRPAHHGTLAYLHPWGEEVTDRCYSIKVFLPLIRARAEELGYTVEVFTFSPTPKEQRRVSRILYSQGIEGVFVGEMPPGQSTLDQIAWNRFSAMALDSSLKSPRLPYISDATPKRIEIPYRKLREAGCRRIGYIARNSIEENVDGLFLAAYLRCLYRDGLSSEKLPPHFYQSWRDLAPLDWLKKYRFDAVIATLPAELIDVLANSPFRVPENLGVAGVYHRPQEGDKVAGCTVDWPLWGRTAVDLLTRRLHHGDRGEDRLQIATFIDTFWQEGASVGVPRKSGS